MIKEYFYSTLNDEMFESRSEAQKAEDEYVKHYFKELDKRAERKRRMMQAQINKPKSTSLKINIL